MNEPIKNLIEHVNERIGNRDRIDDFNPKLVFKRFTFDITLHLFFSVEFNSYKIESDDFISKFLSAKPPSTLLNLVQLLMPLCIAQKMKIVPMQKHTYKYLVQLALNCIRQREKDKKTNYSDLIQLLIETGLPEEEIVGQCLALFLGGFESVSQTCSFALYGRWKFFLIMILKSQSIAN